MILREVKISEVSEVSILPYTQNRKLRYPGKTLFTSNFERSCNLDSEKKIFFEVSEFLILLYTKNRKLWNLGKCYFTSNFGSCCKLRFRNDKNLLRQKFKGQDRLLEVKKWNFRGFRAFDFALHSFLESVLLLQILIAVAT